LAFLPPVWVEVLRLNTHILIYHLVEIVVLVYIVLFLSYFSHSFICIGHSSARIGHSLLQPIDIGILPLAFGNGVNYVFNFVKSFEW
jgi:hypothetical protein